ncbi:hypothetical protein ACRJ4W_37270 [Streptomyces sp. GLT-R25]
MSEPPARRPRRSSGPAEAQVGALCEFRAGPRRTRMRNDTPAGWIKTVCDCHRAWSAREIMIVSGAVRYSGRGGDGLAVAGVG